MSMLLDLPAGAAWLGTGEARLGGAVGAMDPFVAGVYMSVVTVRVIERGV